MKYVSPIRILLLSVLSVALSGSHLSAHDVGSIKGCVTDSLTGDKLIGVNVYAANTMIGTATDINGNFKIINIHQGKYRLIFSFLGYKTFSKEVKVIANKTTVINVKMRRSAIQLDALSIVSEPQFTAASSKEINIIDMAVRPVKSSQDLLKLVPGLITAQHAGGGKAEQIFLRGFDADHGTDINISVDGIPVNMVSHAHGQGYADLHYLIPEIVDEISVFKGPYFARYGDFSTAGSVDIRTKDILDHNLVKLEGGWFNTGKFTMLYQLGKGSEEQNAYGAVQYFTTDGPFESPSKLQRFNIYGKYFTNIGHTGKLTASVSSFSSAWNASGQIPERAVKQGIISRFGSIDNMEGGNTGRTDFLLRYDAKGENNSEFSIRAFLTGYNFKLFSDFTFFLIDSLNGDMIEQNENRTMYGADITFKKVLSFGKRLSKTELGSGFRSDDIQVSLWHSPGRIRLTGLTNDNITQRNLFAWINQELILSSKLRIQGGLRADYFTFNDNDLLGSALDSLPTGLPHGSGYDKKLIINPKLNFVFTPVENLDIFIDLGTSFHSNDTRVVIRSEKAKELAKFWSKQGLDEEEIKTKLSHYNFDPAQLKTGSLPRAYGVELGVKPRRWSRLNLSASLWYMYLESEFVYVGDGGYAELSNPTVRLGIDLSARYRITGGLWADLDMTANKGHITGLPQGQNHIPLAPLFTLSTGLSAMKIHNFDASLRVLHVGDRPANEDNSVRAHGYTLINLGLAYHLKRWTLSLRIENLLNTAWNEAQFATESRLKGESTPVSEIHFTPGNPINAQFGIAVNF